MSIHIKMRINPDGTQTEVAVEGVKGPSCQDLTKQIESKLGKRLKHRQTSEFTEHAENTLETKLGDE